MARAIRRGQKMLRQCDDPPPIFPRKERRRIAEGKSNSLFPILFIFYSLYSLYSSQPKLLDLSRSNISPPLSQTRWRVYGKIVSNKQRFFELSAWRKVASHFRIVTGRGLADILNLYGVYMHGHVLAGLHARQPRCKYLSRWCANLARETANWWKLE